MTAHKGRTVTVDAQHVIAEAIRQLDQLPVEPFQSIYARRALLLSGAYDYYPQAAADHPRRPPKVSTKKTATTGEQHGRLHSPDAPHRHGVVR